MSWGDSDVDFVRPVQAVVMIDGGRVDPGAIRGCRAGTKTLGHTFHDGCDPADATTEEVERAL